MLWSTTRATMSRVNASRLASSALGLVAVCGLLACDGASNDPGKHVVAEVGGQPVTVAQLQAYLDANLVQDPTADQVPPRDLARVKSRLFDDLLDGEILLLEARRRGITVSDAELSDYLGPDPPASPTARESARRDLMIQKLRESAVRAEVHVPKAQIDAWLAAHPSQDESGLAGTLRMLRFASYPEAMRVRTEIVSKKLSFSQAQAAYGADSVPDAAGEVDLGAFPDHIATAVKALAAGQVSQPLPFESSVLLFLLEPPEDPTAAEARRREKARRVLSLEQSETVADQLIQSLRASTSVVRHQDQLPFPYVAEGAAPRAE